jgi:hypothetical protein
LAYLGNRPAESFASFEKQVFTIVNSQTAYTLSHSVTNENDIRLVVNSVVQEPGSGKAYTASGTTLTLSAALTNGTDTMYCVFLGRALQTVNPPNASVGTAQLGSSLDFSSKTITLASNMKNTPTFQAYLSSNQTVSDGVETKIQFNTEDFDTANCYDNSVNYRFTPTVAGKYFVYATVRGNAGTSSLDLEMTGIYKNGSSYVQNQVDYRANDALLAGITVSAIIDMNGSSDYLEGYARCLGGTTINGSSSNRPSVFGAYKIIE